MKIWVSLESSRHGKVSKAPHFADALPLLNFTCKTSEAKTWPLCSTSGDQKSWNRPKTEPVWSEEKHCPIFASSLVSARIAAVKHSTVKLTQRLKGNTSSVCTMQWKQTFAVEIKMELFFGSASAEFEKMENIQDMIKLMWGLPVSQVNKPLTTEPYPCLSSFA